ncbi:MAG: GNAT family N-acetyltransferase [Chitinispirillaceae bacterium]
MSAWEERYKSKVKTPEQAVNLIRPGARIFIGTGCAQPKSVIAELVNDGNNIMDAEIYHLMTMGDAPYVDEQYADKFRTFTFVISQNVRKAVYRGHGDYVPVCTSDIPQLFKSGRLPLDVALIQTSPPDKNGFVSLGVSVDIVKSAVENSLMVIAEVNPNMPRTHGESTLSVDMIDAIVESKEALTEYKSPELNETIKAIGRNVASLISDGATVSLGLGPISQAVYSFLDGKKDLGIHTEMFSDEIIPLIQKGVINGSRKTINRGRITASYCVGSRELYEYINENPEFDFRPSEYVNDSAIIAQHNYMVAVNTAYEVDMTGQVCSDSSDQDSFSGIGGISDFSRGAAQARNGRSIIALQSTTPDGSASRIVPSLMEGAGVALTRGDVHFVVTEYGIADLYGKSIRERVTALAEIAHPDFRNQILQQAQKRHFILPHQAELFTSGARYPKELETRRALADGTALYFRPIKPTDTHSLRDMFYSLSEKSIAFRFLEPIKAFPQEFVQKLANIDYTSDMGIAATIKDMGGERIIGIAHYFRNKENNRAEISFLVRDDWHNKGVGTYLFEILSSVGQKRGVSGFDANVSADNANMLGIFFNSGYNVSTKRENDNYSISFDFGESK